MAPYVYNAIGALVVAHAARRTSSHRSTQFARPSYLQCVNVHAAQCRFAKRKSCAFHHILQRRHLRHQYGISSGSIGHLEDKVLTTAASISSSVHMGSAGSVSSRDHEGESWLTLRATVIRRRWMELSWYGVHA